MGKTMSNTIKWGLSSSAWNTMTGSFQKAYGYIKDLDRSLNNIRIVSGKSADDMARFATRQIMLPKIKKHRLSDALIYYQQFKCEALPTMLRIKWLMRTSLPQFKPIFCMVKNGMLMF